MPGNRTRRGALQTGKAYGFTLIELMIVVTIVAILAMIAYPGYQQYTTRTRRTDAQIALTDIVNKQEKYYSQCQQYAGTLQGGAISACSGLGYASSLSPDRHYLIAISSGNISGGCASLDCGFTATANPNGAGVTGQQRNNGQLRTDALGTKQWDRGNSGAWCCKWSDR